MFDLHGRSSSGAALIGQSFPLWEVAFCFCFRFFMNLRVEKKCKSECLRVTVESCVSAAIIPCLPRSNIPTPDPIGPDESDRIVLEFTGFLDAGFL